MSRPTRYGKMGTSFDSEGNSNSRGTSPPQSPRVVFAPRTSASHPIVHSSSTASASLQQPMYYVQSPSRDSFTINEGDLISQSYARSTPSGSPLASPLHKTFQVRLPPQTQRQQLLCMHRTDVNQFNPLGNPGNLKPGSRQVLPQPKSATCTSQRKGFQPWSEPIIQEEEENYPESSSENGLSRWWAVVLCVSVVLVCIVVIGVVFWIVCRPSPPRVDVKDITFQYFLISEGNDPSGVPTQVLTLNFTSTLVFSNPSKYYGFHVSAPYVQLIYESVVVAQGQIPSFFQGKKSSCSMELSVRGSRTPVYGAGPNLMSAFGSATGAPLKLIVNVRSRANVIWRIVRPKYKSNIECDLVIGTNSKNGSPELLSSQCKT